MNKQFPYFLFHLWFDSIIKISFFLVFVIGLFLVDKQPLGFIVGTLIFIILYKNIFNTIRNLHRSITKKPAVEMTDEYFVNHMNNTKIHWKNIIKIKQYSASGYELIRFDLRDRKNYIRQVKDPIYKFIFLLAPDITYIHTNLSYLKGNNYKIYEEINDFFLKKRNYY